MQKIVFKYLSGVAFFLLVLTIATFAQKFSNLNILAQSATVMEMVNSTNAKPASGYAWNDNIGWINFGTTTSDTGGRVYVSRNKLFGYAWGENVGWISLNCANDEGDSCTSYGVTQDNSDGVLTGYAWGENIGWIDFAPAGGGVSLTTNTSGENIFSGYAWGENVGWISFSGTSTDTSTYGVNTTWVKQGGGSSIITLAGCNYNDPAWGVCLNSRQERTLNAQNIPCEGMTSKYEVQSCTTATSTATTTKDINISISTTSITMFTGEKVEFKATVTGTTTNTGVDWTIIPIETIVDDFYGTISNTGLYTAPDHAVNITIIARAVADVTKSAEAKITVRLKTETATSTSLEVLPEVVEEKNNVTDGSVENTTSGGGDGNLPAALDVSKLVSDNISVLGTTTKEIYLEAQKVVASPVGSAVTKTITTAGVVGGGVAATSVIVLNGTTATDLLFLPFRLWGLLLSALGLKKRNRPWGTVYDSVTKQPLDPAYVTLKKIGSKEENTSITDLDGRYGFLVTPGQYILTANKTNYIFPSQKLAGKNADALYQDLYFGEKLDIIKTGAVLNKNIPLDPVNFDWNEFAKGQKKIMKFYSKREKLIRLITDWLFRLGFIVSVISLFLVTAPYNLIIFGLYLVLTALRKYGLGQRALGALTEKSGDPLSFAIIRVFSPDLDVEITNKVANKIGRYYCLVPKGKYYVKIEKKNDDESYTTILTSKPFDAENGIINKNFVI